MMKIKATLSVLAVLILTLLALVLMPPIRWNHMGFWVMVLMFAFMAISLRVGGSKNFGDIKARASLPAAVALFCVVVIVIGSILTMPFLRSGKYRSLIGNVKTTEFSKSINPVDLTKLPVIDRSYAKILADKKLGNITGMGSQFSLRDDITLISMKENLYWVVPLVHNGFFEWLYNSGEGSPGYIMVSATNPNDVQLVEKPFKYMPEAFLLQNLKRHMYIHGYATALMTDYSFEVDDEGTPYWVVSLYDNKVFFGGANAVGAAVVNAQTGEIKRYTVANAPSWVDRIQPEGFVLKQLADWGEYVHGVLNFSGKDKLKLTEGYNYVYNNGKAYLYSGLTSIGGDQSTVGFVLIGLRDKDVSFYRIGGTQETSAMKSAEGEVQAYNYIASFPILINLDSMPTYFMTLKDKEGLVKQYAMVNVENYSIVGVGSNLGQAKVSYLKKMRLSGDNKRLSSASSSLKSLTAKVQRIASVNADGTTYFYFTLEGSTKIFVATYTQNPKIPVTVVGDLVTITYLEGSDKQINVESFENAGL